MTPSVRLPVEPLLELSGMSMVKFAELVGKTPAEINAFRRLGGFTPHMADRMAAKIHLTPGYVWPDLWWTLPEGSCGPVLTREERGRGMRTEQQIERDRERARRRRRRLREQREMAA